MAEILNIMEGYKPLPPFGSAELVHREAEAMRRAFADRNASSAIRTSSTCRSTGCSPSIRRHAARADRRAGLATPRVRSAGPRPARHHALLRRRRRGQRGRTTTTLNDRYGSGVTVAGAGFLLNDEMDDFATAPGKPNMFGLVQGEANAIAPGKRMLSAMTPTIVLDPRGQLYMVVGTPGGPRIITRCIR